MTSSKAKIYSTFQIIYRHVYFKLQLTYYFILILYYTYWYYIILVLNCTGRILLYNLLKLHYIELLFNWVWRSKQNHTKLTSSEAKIYSKFQISYRHVYFELHLAYWTHTILYLPILHYTRLILNCNGLILLYILLIQHYIGLLFTWVWSSKKNHTKLTSSFLSYFELQGTYYIILNSNYIVLTHTTLY